MKTGTEVVNLFWTGGWDSTFRLLQLLIKQNKIVQPHYLIDTDRRSIYPELVTIRNIKREIFSCFPNTRERLFPTKIMDIIDLPLNPAISESAVRLKKNLDIGAQYDWLARYCFGQGERNIELGFTQGENLTKIIEPLSTCSGGGEDIIYQVDERFKGRDEYTVFCWFRFPLLYLSKLDMQKIAWEDGFQDIMRMTWFCHHPGRRNKPCGLCVPCENTIERGLGWRVPRLNRIKYYLLKYIKRIHLVNKLNLFRLNSI